MVDILGQNLDQSVCGGIYYHPFIPYFGQESEFSLITVCLEFLILLFLLSCILRKKWYQCRGEETKARSLLLPFYDRVLYYYCAITIWRIILYFIQYIYEVSTPPSKSANSKTPIWLIFGDTIGVIGIIGLEVFILFLLCQTSAGTKAYKRAYKATIIVCCIELIIILTKHFHGKWTNNFISFCIGELMEEIILLLIFICVFVYSYFYQMVRNRKRERNKILYVYILLLCILFCIMIIAYILLIFRIDGYCLDVIDQYLFRLIFPWIAFITIRSDSEFWRLLLLSWQTSASLVGENGEVNDSVWNKIKTLFGSRSDGKGKKSFLNPLIDALSMGVKMVDFTELQEMSDPIAMGSTATVSKAKLGNEEVAIKVFIFDELSLEVVSEFFRESLLISDLHHQNIVEFKGACLRPPELCLVYEYCCCGDLTHLILTQYFHPKKQNDEEEENEQKQQMDDPKLFKNRIKMLIDVTRGMSRLHDSGIIHRDLKTSNVLVHWCNGKYVAKVCDFGSARKIIHKNGAKAFGNSVSPKASNYIPPPKRMEASKSTSAAVENESTLKNKQMFKSLNKKVKKHQIVIENRSENEDKNNKKNDEQKTKHIRSMTVNISKGLFGRSNKSIKNRTSPKTEEAVPNSVKLHKASVNYDDMEEEEKFDQPKKKSTPGKFSFDDVDDAKTEATDLVTELNFGDRDPMQLAFSVSPILMTTQVGTLAFMAPEILSHVNIGVLSGGWQNKEEKKEKKEKKSSSSYHKNEINEQEEEKAHEMEVLKESETMDSAVKYPLPPPPITGGGGTHRTSPSGNHLVSLQHHHSIASKESGWTTTTATDSFSNPNTLKSDTKEIVIKINSDNEEIKSRQQRQFSQEYIAKLKSLQKDKNKIKASSYKYEKKSLPPPPPPKSGLSRSLKQAVTGMFTSSANNDAIAAQNWAKRDIYAYNYGSPNQYNSYTNRQDPNISIASPIMNSPSSMKYSIPLKTPPNKALPSNPSNLSQQINSNIPQPPMAFASPNPAFSTISSNGRVFYPKNKQMYQRKALPPDPPKQKRQKAHYYSRDRSRSKFGAARSRKGSAYSRSGLNIDDNASIYETQKFEIIYEASDNALYDDSVDVYSFAVIMWEMALCDRIYNQMDMRQIRDMVCEGKRMKITKYSECQKNEDNGMCKISETVYDALSKLVHECWAQSPIDRPKFYQIEKELEVIQKLHKMKTDHNHKKKAKHRAKFVE